MGVKEKFIKKYGKYAILVERATGFPAKLLLVQAALETGWGRYVKGNNLYGIKDTELLEGEVWAETQEYTKEGWKKVVDDFEVFKSPSESMLFLVAMYRHSPRYKGLYELAQKDYKAFFEELEKRGYATDPGYAEKLTSIYKHFPKNWQSLI